MSGSCEFSTMITLNRIEGPYSRHPDQSQVAEDASMASRTIWQRSMNSQRKWHWQAQSLRDDMLQTHTANQLDRSQNQWISVERARRAPRTTCHYEETETTIPWTHDQSTEPQHAYFWSPSARHKRQRTTKETLGRRRKRLDWHDAGRVHANSKRRRELERASASFSDLRPSAMKMETRRWQWSV